MSTPAAPTVTKPAIRHSGVVPSRPAALLSATMEHPLLAQPKAPLIGACTAPHCPHCTTAAICLTKPHRPTPMLWTTRPQFLPRRSPAAAPPPGIPETTCSAVLPLWSTTKAATSFEDNPNTNNGRHRSTTCCNNSNLATTAAETPPLSHCHPHLTNYRSALHLLLFNCSPIPLNTATTAPQPHQHPRLMASTSGFGPPPTPGPSYCLANAAATTTPLPHRHPYLMTVGKTLPLPPSHDTSSMTIILAQITRCRISHTRRTSTTASWPPTQ